MNNNTKISSYTVTLSLKDSNINIHGLSVIFDNFIELFTSISKFTVKDKEHAQEPKIVYSNSGNQITFTIGSNGENKTHEYMRKNIGVLLLCFNKDDYEKYKANCHSTVRYRVKELLKSVKDVGVSEIKISFSGNEKVYYEKDIIDFLNNEMDDYKGSKMLIDVQEGMKYLGELLSQVKCVVDKGGKKNKFYENPQFIFRGITKFYPSKKDIQEKYEKEMNEAKDRNDKFAKELENVEKDLITSSLSVRLRVTSSGLVKKEEYIRAHYVDALETIIRKAKNMYPNKYTMEMSDLDVLADVQHYGGATCLVDFSKNILTAIWFACSTDPESNGFLYCYNVTEDMISNDSLTQIRQEDEKRSIHDLLAQTYKETNVCSDVDTRFCLWEPSKRNNRIFRQDSVFLFGIEQFEVNEHAVYVIGIRAEWKQQILAAMKSIFNISGSTVYNDYVGFASNTDKKRPYRKMGESTYTRGYANMIQGSYWSALKFLKLSEVDAYRESWDKKKLLELYFSLGVCYKGLGKQERTEFYRENALLEYGRVIELAKEIVIQGVKNDEMDYYKHKAMRAYNARISLMYELERYKKAIEECIAVKNEINYGLLSQKDNNMKMTSKYCDISILKLQALETLSHFKKIGDVIDFDVNCVKYVYPINKKNASKINFWDLTEEYYKTILGILSLRNMCNSEKITRDDIRAIIDNWYLRAQNYFKLQKQNDRNYIPWIFKDIKRVIDNLPIDSPFYRDKEILQDLTAGVISLRDTYEIHAWSSKEGV